MKSRTPDYWVDPETGCWEWAKSRDGKRYPMKWVDGAPHLAHRWYWEQRNGPIPAGLVIDHVCANTFCVNPDHLEPVTQRENVMRSKGITAKNAQKTHCAKGHPFNEANTAFRKNGGRTCLACKRENNRCRMDKKRRESGVQRRGARGPYKPRVDADLHRREAA